MEITNNFKSLTNKESIKELSLLFATLFTPKDLISIAESISMLESVKSRDITIKEYELYSYKGANSTAEIIIKDILIIYQYPPERYIEFTFKLSYNIIFDRLTYAYSNKVIDILLDIVTNAYNYSAYCYDSLTPTYINTSNMYKNFTYKILSIFESINNFRDTDEFKKLEAYILECKLNKGKENYISTFDFKNSIHIELCTVNHDIAKLSIYNRYSRYILYIPRGVKGYATLLLIMELLKNKEKIYP